MSAKVRSDHQVARRLVRSTVLDRTHMESFDAIYGKYRDTVLRFAIRCVGRREIAEELTAEAFLQLHLRWDSIDTDRLPSWLLTVVKNRAADHWRKVGLERIHADAAPKSAAHPSQNWTGLFENPALKPGHRICLILRYIHEMTVREIAERLGLSEGQVKGHLQYARELLRKQLSAEVER